LQIIDKIFEGNSGWSEEFLTAHISAVTYKTAIENCSWLESTNATLMDLVCWTITKERKN